MAKPPTCRKLFEDDDDDSHSTAAAEENSRNFLNEEMRRDYEAKSLKWNFNFKEGIPLPGDWEWEGMIEDEPDGDVEVKDVVESAPEAEAHHPTANEETPNQENGENQTRGD